MMGKRDPGQRSDPALVLESRHSKLLDLEAGAGMIRSGLTSILVRALAKAASTNPEVSDADMMQRPCE